MNALRQHALFAAALTLWCAGNAAAQQLDATAFAGSRTAASLLDRAESGAERREFIDLQKAATPAERLALASGFLARYPRSWLVTAVLQIAAAAAIEARDYGRALSYGRASLRLLPENPPMLIALAQIEAAAGNPRQAERDARDAWLWLSLFAPPAGVKASRWQATRRSLEERALAIIQAAGGRPPAVPSGERRREKPWKFAGSDACRPCHAAIYDSWRKSGMAAMLRPLPEAALLADFSESREFRETGGPSKVRTGGGAQPYFEFERPGGGWTRYRVDFVIGSKWQQAYATRVGGDRIFVFPIQYNALQKRWLNYWRTIDGPESERAAIENFPQLSPATSYQRNCASCHTSQLRLMRLDDDTMQRAAFREPGINCEMCHGPSAPHVSAVRSGDARLEDALPPFRFASLDRVEATLICGQCHRQSGLRNLGAGGEMNYAATAPYFNRIPSQPYVEFGTRAFYKDGRFRETTFIGEAFMRSACFRRGTAQCASCHNPHPPDAEGNRNSLKFLADPDRMCLQCHPAFAKDTATHTRHAPASAGSRCAGCHMPPIMNSLMFQAASHQIDDIPRAETTLRFGRDQSPNACLLCHRDKDDAWLVTQLERWRESTPARVTSR